MSSKIKTTVAIIVFILFLFIIQINYKYKLNELKSNFYITTGLVTGYSIGVKYHSGNMFITSTYSVQNKENENSKQYSKTLNRDDFRNYFLGKSFPVIYSVKDISNSRTLIFPSDFEEFNIPFPDSLNWVKQYIEK